MAFTPLDRSFGSTWTGVVCPTWQYISILKNCGVRRKRKARSLDGEDAGAEQVRELGPLFGRQHRVGPLEGGEHRIPKPFGALHSKLERFLRLGGIERVSFHRLGDRSDGTLIVDGGLGPFGL